MTQQTNGRADPIDVLVVGAGPTGLTLAIDLARRGVACHVVEAAEERGVNPRCNTTSARSMEIFRRLGLADDIRRAGLPAGYPTTIQYRTALRGEEIFRIDLPSARDVLAGAGKEGWPTPEPQHRISQLFLEPILERHARSLPGLTLERGTRLVGLRQREDHVEAVVETGGTTRVLRCSYLVGCDGSHSMVRRGLGFRYQGVDAIRKFVSTFVRSAELGRLAARDRAWTYWTYGRGQSSLIAIDGDELWLNHVAFAPDHDTEGEDPERLLREAVGGEVEHEVLGVARWTGRRLVAERYNEGRVFLAGDAAHLWIPVGGFGMNAGIQDAATLGWMLAAVRHGWAPPDLLAAYEKERKPVGEQFAAAVGSAAQASLADVSPDVHLPGPDGARARAALAGRAGGDGAAPVLAGRLQLRLPLRELAAGRRGRGPGGRQHGRVPGPGAGGFPAAARLARRRQAGARRPRARLHPAADRPHRRRAAVGRRGGRAGDPLTTVDLPGDCAGRYPTPLLLVRPDQHVAWMGGADARPEELLRTVTGRVAARQG
ncbi:FAD-dependent monooxygenase [Actinomadura madurae]|uniref:FAD-dependent monooxygenase n=1 Tax=Actinomadura madurae TaxID=1993 RepID=UPI0020D25DC2|nr:FAD-dependent monooxygenase [Actinomadura madurae]MCQ0014470.1 FAD-dependent monooxygenase [Actinomadura madurae]